MRLKYITKGALELPTVALSQAGQEIRRLGHFILDHMLQMLPRALTSGDARWLMELEKAEREVDWYYTQTNNFLRELFGRNITREQIAENHKYQLIVKELESIADCLVVMGRLVQKTPAKSTKIADCDWALLEGLYVPISANYLALLRFFDLKDPIYAQRIIDAQHEVIEAHNKLQRGIAGQDCHSESDWQRGLTGEQNIVMELGNWFYKIGEHIFSIAREIK
jgi:phosphate:Na+ symporter